MSLREFITQHRYLSEVSDIHALVNPDVDLSALVYAQMHKRSPSIMWFHKLERSAFSVVSNLFATRERLSRVLTHADKPLEKRLEQLPPSVESWTDFNAYIKQDFACIPAAELDTEVEYIEIDSLYDLPQVRYWSGDTCAYFSLPTVFTRAFDSSEINAGIYRLTPIDARSMTLNWRSGSRAYKAWRLYADRGERMPLTVVMGVDPALIFASMFPLPDVGAELAFWGFIRGCPQRLQFSCDGLPLPEGAEIVVEGYVDPVFLHYEGSFANHTGFYTESVPCPVMHVSRIRARNDAVMPITVVGPPPTENALLGTTIWQLLFIYIRRELPYLLYLICPAETAHLPVVIIQVQAPKNIAEWKMRKEIILQHSILKRVHTLVLVDEHTEISDSRLIYWHCMNLENGSYAVSDSGQRVVDGVLWRYQGKCKVRKALIIKNNVL